MFYQKIAFLSKAERKIVNAEQQTILRKSFSKIYKEKESKDSF